MIFRTYIHGNSHEKKKLPCLYEVMIAGECYVMLGAYREKKI